MPLRDLRLGMSGEDVRAIQQTLNLHNELPGPALVVNGQFDAAMEARVRAFQTSEGLPQTGVVDAAVRLALYPFGVATITILASRLTLPALSAPALSSRIPNFSNYQLTPPSFALPRLGSSWDPLPRPRWGPRLDAHTDLRDHIGWSDPTRLTVDWTGFTTEFRLQAEQRSPDLIVDQVRIPGVGVPLPVDRPIGVPTYSSTSNVRGPFSVLGFDYNHLEVVPGVQSTFPWGGLRQDAFTLTIQMIYQRGPDDGANQTITTGVQIGDPLVANFPNGAPWTFNPFIQFTDVDRFGALGNFHWWQPYGQIGAQIQGPGDLHPTINGGLFPLNLGYDITKFLTLQFQAGIPFALDLQTGVVTWGAQAGFGLALKLGGFQPVVRWGQQ